MRKAAPRKPPAKRKRKQTAAERSPVTVYARRVVAGKLYSPYSNTVTGER